MGYSAGKSLSTGHVYGSSYFFAPSHLGADGDGSLLSPWRLSTSVRDGISNNDTVYIQGVHKSLNDELLLLSDNQDNIKFVSDPDDPGEIINAHFVIPGDDVSWVNVNPSIGKYEYLTSGWGGGNPTIMVETSGLSVTHASADTRLTPVASAALVLNPGEYFLDSATNKFTVIPTDGDLPGHTYLVPRANNVGLWVGGQSNILVDGIKFALTNTNLGHINFDGEGLTVRNCDFTHTSNHTIHGGLSGKTSTKNITISNNYFHHCTVGVYINSNGGGHCHNVRVIGNRFENMNNTTEAALSSDGHDIGLEGAFSDVIVENNVSGIDSAGDPAETHGVRMALYYDSTNRTVTQDVIFRNNYLANVSEYWASGITIHGFMFSGDNTYPANLVKDVKCYNNVIENVSGMSGGSAAIRCKQFYSAGFNPVEIYDNYLIDCDNGFIGNGNGVSQQPAYNEHDNIYIGNTLQSNHSTGHGDNTQCSKDDNQFFEVDSYNLEGSNYTSLATYKTACSGVIGGEESGSTYSADGSTVRAAAAVLKDSIIAQARSA